MNRGARDLSQDGMRSYCHRDRDGGRHETDDRRMLQLRKMLPLTRLQCAILELAAKGTPLQPAALADDAAGTTFGTPIWRQAKADIDRLLKMGYLEDVAAGDLATSAKGLARIDPASPWNRARRCISWLATSAIGGAVGAAVADWLRTR